jgi:Holliday junction resolvase RusA-like endonuclease
MTKLTVGKIEFNNAKEVSADWDKRYKNFMEETVITIPDLPISRNQIDNAHWTVRGKYKKELEMIVRLAAKGIKPIKGCVTVHTHFVFADNRKHDYDNYMHKALMDAIVRSGIIEDDNIDVIKFNSQSAERGTIKETRITIRRII